MSGLKFRDLKLVATVEFWGKERGGRNNPPTSGYHGQIDLGDVQTSCVFDVADAEEKNFDLNHPVSAIIFPMMPSEYGSFFKRDSVYPICEGSHRVGTAKILEIVVISRGVS